MNLGSQMKMSLVVGLVDVRRPVDPVVDGLIGEKILGFFPILRAFLSPGQFSRLEYVPLFCVQKGRIFLSPEEINVGEDGGGEDEVRAHDQPQKPESTVFAAEGMSQVFTEDGVWFQTRRWRRNDVRSFRTRHLIRRLEKMTPSGPNNFSVTCAQLSEKMVFNKG